MPPIPLRPWLEHLARHLPVARLQEDPEGVHQMRVASGRLGVWLDLAGWDVLRDDLSWLRGSAGRVRELDVLLADELPPDFSAWLEERRRAERSRLLAVLDRPRLAGLLTALSQLPPVGEKRARARLARFEARAARKGRALEAEPHDVARSHALRKALRRVRFAREWIGEPSKTIKPMLSSLGDLNDAAVALELLGRFPGRAGCEALRARCAEQIEAQRALAFERWKRSGLRARSRA